MTWALSLDVVQPAKTTPVNGSADIGSRQSRCIPISLPSVDGSTGYYELQLLDESFSPPVLVGILDVTPAATFATPSGYPLYSEWAFTGVGNYGGYLYLQPTLTGSPC